MLRSAQRASYAPSSRFYYRCETSARVGNPVSRPRAASEGRGVLHVSLQRAWLSDAATVHVTLA